MRVLKAKDGVRTLKAMTTAASSAQMLDLNSISLQHQANPEHAAQPFFAHPVLNRAIILKHSPRDTEPGLKGGFASKVIFPFDHTDLELGGQVMVIEHLHSPTSLTQHLDYAGPELERDLKILRIIAGLPTLDPFLLRETLMQQRLQIAPCYFRLSPADREKMHFYVAEAVQSLISACFGAPTAGSDKAARMSEILLSAEGGPELDPLRLALRMGAVEFAEAMFAWKGFLYYRWRSGELAPEVRDAKSTIGRISTRHYGADWGPFVGKAKDLLEKQVAGAVRDINTLLGRYDRAFASLSSENPEPFREFLVQGSRQFAILGDRIGRLEQVVSVCRHRLEPAGRSPDHLWDVVRDLLHELSPPRPIKATAA